MAQARRIARDNSPTPNGYVCNRGLAFIPVHILADGRRTPAKYIHVVMSGNPEVYALLRYLTNFTNCACSFFYTCTGLFFSFHHY